MEFNLGEPYGLLGAVAQLILALGVFGNMLLSWRNNRKITEVHIATDTVAITAQKAVELAQAAVGDATAQLQDVKETTLQVRDEVIAVIKNGNGHK